MWGSHRVALASLWLALAATAGCGLVPSDVDPVAAPGGGDPAGGQQPEASTSWAPAPRELGATRLLAESGPEGFVLHTASGDKTFLPGVNLGSTTPLHQPGELAIEASDYRRWFGQMGRFGVRAVRVYTIHPPAFYDELVAYNRAHPDRPLYLVQGVYLPDESYAQGRGTLYDERVDRSFAAELVDASAAVHGRLRRDPAPGRAAGSWTSDVSPWLVAWIAGVEWDPHGVARTDEQHRDAAYRPGRFFVATDDASPTERWLARHLDTLAAAETESGVSVPIAFVNWSTTDPLDHPDEPDPDEDLASVDADHVRATDAWPAGTFASYHAYPYYPDFLHHEQQLARTEYAGRADPYAGYLDALVEHHELPVMVTEVGVPSSLGSAHEGPLGRDQGGHSERQAMQIDADLLHLVAARGMAGGLVFSWTDEWFKRTWNTMAHQVPAARRQLWHDPLTNEQHFGIVATDSDPVPDSAREQVSPTGPVEYVLATADASYLHLDITVDRQVPRALTVSFDTVGSLAGDDYRIALDLRGRSAQAWVRAELDPVRLDAARSQQHPDTGRAWHRYRLLTSLGSQAGGRARPAEYQDVGVLREGGWQPGADGSDSRATWQLLEEHRTVRMRVPWPMLGLGDPSSRTALGPGVPARAQVVDQITLGFEADGRRTVMDYTWPGWNHLGHTERLKDGADVLARAFAELGR